MVTCILSCIPVVREITGHTLPVLYVGSVLFFSLMLDLFCGFFSNLGGFV